MNGRIRLKKMQPRSSCQFNTFYNSKTNIRSIFHIPKHFINFFYLSCKFHEPVIGYPFILTFTVEQFPIICREKHIFLRKKIIRQEQVSVL